MRTFFVKKNESKKMTVAYTNKPQKFFISLLGFTA
jgi:hypothetical protein